MKLQNRSYPDPFATDNEKKTNEYGLLAAQHIASEWFANGMINDNTEYSSRQNKIKENRLFSRGMQPVDDDKTLMSRNSEDLNHLNLDWTPINLGGKFVDITRNSVREDLYTIEINATDKISTQERKSYSDDLQKYMLSRKMLEKAKEAFNIDLMPKGFVPQDEEELEMHIALEFKPKTEILEELLIKYVKESNDWHVTKEMVDRDVTENGFGAVKIVTDKLNGIVPSYVDIENLVYGNVTQKNFKDVNYYGEVMTKTISQLMVDSDLSDKDLRKIAKLYKDTGGNGNTNIDYSSCNMQDIVDHKVKVMFFTFETSKAITYKKKFNEHGSFKMVPRDDSYNPAKRSDYQKSQKRLNTWYEGFYIIGSDEFVYNYRESEILARDKMNKAMSPFIVYAAEIYQNTPTGILDRIKPIAKEMQRVHLKLQQLVAEIRPDGAEIDIDMLAELERKSGGKLTWEDAVSMFNAKGLVLTTRAHLGEEGVKDRAGLRTPTSGGSNKISQLIEAWYFYYNMLRDITGINAARDGSQPADSLVGVNKLQISQSNLATKGTADASLEISRKTSEVISTRLQDIFRWGDDLKKIYTNVVGSQNIKLLESLENRHLHEFGFTVRILPTEEELQNFRESLAISLQEGSITVDDKMRAQRIAKNNVKQAEAFLTYRRKKTAKDQEESQMRLQQQQAESNTQTALQVEDARRKSEQFSMQLEIQKAQQLAIIEVMKQNEMNEVNEAKEDKKYEVEIFKERLRAAAKMDSQNFAEDRKDKRQNLTDTNQSKMIDQRQKDSKGPIDFKKENGNESLFNI